MMLPYFQNVVDGVEGALAAASPGQPVEKSGLPWKLLAWVLGSSIQVSELPGVASSLPSTC
jgi:hypothetical protein